ncbi:hypothetical protein GXW71_06220 [Roseomonas hellenica]|uniref:DUF4136 domain-containing protein n=1 Tax=Plastoroseomonas hellenica TaxID=2687306 RepID=A0ABS5EUH4_9PROT|nr:hypothetical protein [Plastoroseomonas hellenica]MBR0663950.1 hypothetical protein [Plastoroseomonas hellenica]
MPASSLRPSPCLLAGALALAGCAGPPPGGTSDGTLAVTASIRGVVHEPRMVLSHPRDDRHRCRLPAPAELAAATGAAPAAAASQQPFHYTVEFGPDFPPPVPGAARPTEEWLPYGPQTRFTLEVFFTPDGPARPRRAVRITVAAGGRLWQRMIEADDPAAEASVTIAADGLSGSLRAGGLVQQIPHNRMPETEAIAIEARWRCPG